MTKPFYFFDFYIHILVTYNTKSKLKGRKISKKISMIRRSLFVVRISYVVCRQLIIDVISTGENNNH